MIKKIENIKSKFLKNKAVVISLIFIILLILFGVLFMYSYGLPERITEVNLSSEKSDYTQKDAGSWNVNKSVKWIDSSRARITFKLDSVSKKLDDITCSDTVIILDTSNSLSEKKLNNIKQATIETINSIFKDKSIENRASLITFNSSSNIVLNLTNNENTLISNVNNITIGGNSNGDTNYYLALKSLDDVLNGSSCVKTAIFVTDGYPNVGTPNQLRQYDYLKDKYKDLTISGIQYDMGEIIGNPIKEISDFQYSVNEGSLKQAMIESSGLAVNKIYDEFNLTDSINGEFFSIDDKSVTNDVGNVSINNDEIKWDLAGIKTGASAKMNVDIELKSEYRDENRDYVTNNNEKIVSKIDDIEEEVETTESPILYRTYNVSYDMNEPEGCEIAEIENSAHSQYDVVEINEEKPECDGYKFKGWKIITEDVTKYNDDYFEMPGTDVLLRAEWGKLTINKNLDGEVYDYRQVDVEVKVENGTVDEEKKTITRDDSVTFEIEPNIGYDNPTVTCTNNGRGSINGSTLTVKDVQESTVCTIVYDKVIYSITYNLNGGSVDGNPITYDVDTPTFTLKNPIKTGYTFLGWTGSNGSTPETTVTIEKGSIGNRTYTANWEINKYTVGVEITNGSVTGDKIKEINYGDDGIFTVTPDTGHHITGVSCTNGQTGSISGSTLTVSNVTDDTVCTVNVDVNTYQIKYNANGGSGNMTNSVHTYDVPRTLTKNAFTRTGYTFLGWSRDKNATEAIYTDEESVVNLTTSNNEIVNLYAVWKINTYTVNVVVQNGTVDPSTKKADYNTSPTFTVTPTTGYHYSSVSCTNGQTGSMNGTTLTINNVSNDTTCTVSNTINTYTVVYNANGGEGTTANSIHTYNVSETLTKNGFTRSGYVFAGWSTSSSSSTVAYSDEESVINLTSTNDATINLYAVWKRKLTVTFDINGASSIGATSASCIVESGNTCSVTAPSITAASGFSVVGWNTNRNATSASVNVGGTITISSDTTYYAITKSDSAYTVTFEGNGATLSSESESCYRYNGSSTCSVTTPSITRSGYTISGYNTSASSTTASIGANASLSVSGSTTYYAVTSKELTATFYRNGATSITPSGGTATTATSVSEACTIYNTTTSCNVTSPSITKSGWTIVGWGTSSSSTTSVNSVNTSITLTSNISRYAVTSKYIYISYNANGGSGAPSSSGKTIYNTSTSASITISSTKPTRSGYTFSGWSTSSTAYSPSYYAGSTYSFSASDTLYAVWDRKTYTVSLSVTNGTVSGSSSKTVNHGSSTSFTTIPNSPTDRYEITSVSCTNGQSASYSGNSISVSNVTSNTKCTVTYTPQWTGVSSSSCVAGRTLTYAGLSWTVLGTSSGQCRLALNSLKGSGTYNNSTSYLTTNFLNTNSTLKSEAANGAIVPQSGYYVTTNSGSATGISSTSDANALYWINSGTVRAGRTYYSYGRSAAYYYRGYAQGRIGNISPSNIRTSLYTGTSQSTAITANTNLSVSNSAGTYTIANGVRTSSSAGLYAVTYGRHRPQKSCVNVNGNTVNSSADRIRFRRASYAQDGSTTQAWGCLTSYRRVNHTVCGASNTVALRAHSATQHRYYSNYSSGSYATRNYYNNGEGWEYIFAGAKGGEVSSSSDLLYVYDHADSANCSNRTVYTLSSKTLNINYRPYIIVKTY